MRRNSRHSSIVPDTYKADVDVINLQRVPEGEDFDDEISYTYLAGKGNAKKTRSKAAIRLDEDEFYFKNTKLFDEYYGRKFFKMNEVRKIIVYDDYPSILNVYFRDSENEGANWYWFIRFKDEKSCAKCSRLFTSYINTLNTRRRSSIHSQRRSIAESVDHDNGRNIYHTIQTQTDVQKARAEKSENRTNSLPMRQLPNSYSTQSLNVQPMPIYAVPTVQPNIRASPSLIEEYDKNGIRRVYHYESPYGRRTPNIMHNDYSGLGAYYNGHNSRSISYAVERGINPYLHQQRTPRSFTYSDARRYNA